MTTKLRYTEFRDYIDLDAFYEAIGFIPESTNQDNDIGFCLFPEAHKNGDTTGKFGIHRDKKVWNCWVCGGGDLLSLVMLLFDWEVDPATEYLYQFTHGEHKTDDEFADYLVAQLEDEEKSITRLPYFNERVLDRFDGPTDYFIIERGLSPEVVERYKLRYSDTCLKPAPVRSNKGAVRVKIADDYIGPAAIWPHFWQGRLVGWQYRWAEDRPHWVNKWTNTTDFPKEETLFNYERALQTRDPVVVVESVATALFCETYHIPAVAYFGSKPTGIQQRLLRRLHHGVILAPDNDSNKAGDKIFDTIQYLERFIPVYVTDTVDLGDGADLGDYVKTTDPGQALLEHLSTRTIEISV